MSMKTASNLFSLVGVVVLFIYGYALLSFIQASSTLWGMWLLSIVVAVANAMLSMWARDEYYAEQFGKVMKKAEA